MGGAEARIDAFGAVFTTSCSLADSSGVDGDGVVLWSVEDIFVNGPPWRMRAAARVHHWVPGADGSDLYANRAMLVVDTRWGKIRRQEDYEDTVRVLDFDSFQRSSSADV